MRVTIESWGLQDPRLYMLADELGIRRREALGLVTDVWYGTQEAHLVVAPMKMIRALCRPEGAPWTPDEAVEALIAVGYLSLLPDGNVEVRGNAKHVDKLLKAKASADARWKAERDAMAMRTHMRSDMRKACDRHALPDPDPDSKTEKRESENAQVLSSTPLSAVADPPASTENNKLTKTGLPPAALLTLWTEIAVPAGLPRCMALAGKRKPKAQARCREHPDEDYWRDVITRIARSDFCRGDNDRGWRADIDFLLAPDSATKVLEGKYDARDKPLANGSASGYEDRPTKAPTIWRSPSDVPV